jgi:hypothetical protein
MTDRALWAAAQEDYTNALAIATKAWSQYASSPEAIQAAAATVLIHITKLRSEPHIRVHVPHVAAPQPAEAKTAAQSGAVPPGIPAACPKCNGKVWDNRENKKNPKAPDWKCRDKACVDEKGFTTGGWVEKPKAGGRFAVAGAKPPAQSFDELPEQLDDNDDLPF